MENLSLFDTPEGIQEQIHVQPLASLDVVKMEFAGAETLSWQELFSGFDTLHAITYSSGIDFVYQLIDLFEKAEILFGCDEVISYSLQEVMAYQCKMIERMRATASKMKLDLVSRIENGTLRFYVARSVLSHEKIYLLSNKDGRKRVIMGSANLSRSAFGGYQRENICYVDGDAAYDWYWDCYCQLRENCTDQIAKETLLCADAGEHLEELPIARTIKAKKALILQPTEEVKDEVRFVLDVKNLAGKFTPSVPKSDKKGKLMLSPEKIKSIRRQVVAAQTQEKELQSEYPQLEVSSDELMVRLNDVELNLYPSRAEVEKDVALFLKYMDGYEKFHGDYPVFGLVYGQSKAGKTSFLETLLKMMIGQKTKISAPDFTRSSIEALKRTVKGAPIIVDDLTNSRFNQHAIETIKNDDFGVADRLLHYPAVVISANEDVKAVAPEVIRRTVICRVQAGLTNTEVMRSSVVRTVQREVGTALYTVICRVQAGLTNTEVMRSSVVRTVQREVGTALYREYLRRMLAIVSDLLEEMKNDESESAPDILAESSQVLVDIFQEYSEIPCPEYIRLLTLEDYFSEKVTGSYAIKTIRNAWDTSRSSFEME